MHFDFVFSVYLVFSCVFQVIRAYSFWGDFIKIHLSPSLMIILDHLGESSILNFHISDIEDDRRFPSCWQHRLDRRICVLCINICNEVFT